MVNELATSINGGTALETERVLEEGPDESRQALRPPNTGSLDTAQRGTVFHRTPNHRMHITVRGPRRWTSGPVRSTRPVRSNKGPYSTWELNGIPWIANWEGARAGLISRVCTGYPRGGNMWAPESIGMKGGEARRHFLFAYGDRFSVFRIQKDEFLPISLCHGGPALTAPS